MARSTPRPSGGRPAGRRGRGGVGPGPGYKPTAATKKGTKHKGKTGGGGGAKPPNKCCPMVEALVSVKRGKYRLAWRYARLSARLLAERIA